MLSFLFGVVTGVAGVLALGWYFLSFFLLQPHDKLPPLNPQKSSTFQLPPALISKISDESCKSKESCWALNFVLYFLFRELRNSEGIRGWILRKLSLEFEELLSTSVLGKFFSNISIQNMDLGQNFPVLSWIKTANVELHPVFKNISTLDILVDLDYGGGFQFSIQADTHLKHSAYLSIQFNEVKGQARLQFTTEPYAHWSFSFAENPDIDISVVSQLYGKSFSHITSIIASQLKRSVRKKHTLPMYKIRYKPFFSRVEPILAALLPNSAPKAEVRGNLTVTVMEVRGLNASLLAGSVYSALALADFDWVGAYVADEHGSVSIVRDLVYVKNGKKENSVDFTLGIVGEVPIIESLASANSSNSNSKQHLEFEVGDEILAVDGKKVTSVKQCIKNFKYSTSMKVIWRIRRKYYSAILPRVEEPAIETLTEPKEPSANSNASLEDSKTNKIELALEKENWETNSDSSGESQSSGGGNKNVAFRASLHEPRHFVISRTSELAPILDPIWSETFSFKVEEAHRYLNLGVWSKVASVPDPESSSSQPLQPPSPTSSPNKRSKNAANLESLTFGDARLIGNLCIPLADVIAECCTTGMGHFIKDYYLRSPEGGAAEMAKELPLMTHSGFEPHMCYGKLSLSFHFKSEEDAAKRRDSAESELGSSSVEIATDALAPEQSPSPTEEFASHQFIRTHFRSANVCDYCNKKIWLKEAFACRICHMKCHKKCNDRCLANTICKGENSYPTIPNLRAAPAPEIIEPDPEEAKTWTNGVRRRTLGGLIVSAVANRSSSLSLRRVGSANNLLSPNSNSNASSKSLPPSPKASPTTSRKASSTSLQELNPFEVLAAGGFGSSEEDISAAVEHLIQNPNDDLVALAKETGRDVYSDLSLGERKRKLNHVLTRIQEEIDSISTKRMELSQKEIGTPNRSAKLEISEKISKYEERVQALALLMLYYCSGLQQVQDLEENHELNLEEEDEEDKK